MRMVFAAVLTLGVGLVTNLYAGVFSPLPSTNAVSLNFDDRIQESTRDSIRVDFQRCLTPSAQEIELYHFDDDPTDCFSLAGLWYPYCFAATSGRGPNLPGKGILSNGTFAIDISYAFATNYRHHIDGIAAYSNEIAAAYAFLGSLSPTNLGSMATNELLSMDLWKEVPPGEFPTSEEDIDSALAYCRNRRVFDPPLMAFHVWECGPTNNPPYLWCTVPGTNGLGRTSSSMLIFFQNRWWFSSWPFLEGEQQW